MPRGQAEDAYRRQHRTVSTRVMEGMRGVYQRAPPGNTQSSLKGPKIRTAVHSSWCRAAVWSAKRKLRPGRSWRKIAIAQVDRWSIRAIAWFRQLLQK